MINDAAHFECNKALDSVGGFGTPIPYLDITAHVSCHHKQNKTTNFFSGMNKIKQQLFPHIQRHVLRTIQIFKPFL